ncbi:MAG: pitrilysin family protein [Acidobacteriota bacterium]
MKYRKTTLENGLKVVTLSLPAARSVTLGLLVEAGAAVERPDQQGLAHLVEHMIFQGSSNRDALEIARLMDGAGGRIGGFTSRDYTCYFAQVLQEFVPYAIDLLGDVLLNPVFPDEALEREKQAIFCEYEAGRDNPEQLAHETLRAAMWPDHPLGRPVLGDPSCLQGMSREDLIYFMHTHYQPDRMVVAAAGALIHEDFVAQVRDAFWRLLGTRARTPVRRPVSHAALEIESADVSQTYFSLGLQAPSFAAEDRYSAHLLDQVLGAGISSRLFVSLREQHGLVYHVGTTYDAWRDAGLLSVEGSTAPATLPQTIDLILAELDGIVRGSRQITEDELHRAKIRLRSHIQLAGEDTHALMSRLATQELYFDRYLSEAAMLEEIAAIQLDELNRWIAKTLAPAFDSASLAIVGPAEAHCQQLHESLRSTCSRHRHHTTCKEPNDDSQTTNQEELDRDPEASRRPGQRDRRQDLAEGREDSEGVARGRDRQVRQALTSSRSGAAPEVAA